LLTLANTGYRVLTGLNAPAPGTRCTYITDLAAIRRVFVHLGRDKHVGASPRPSGCAWQVKYGVGRHLRAPATAAGTSALRTCIHALSAPSGCRPGHRSRVSRDSSTPGLGDHHCVSCHGRAGRLAPLSPPQLNRPHGSQEHRVPGAGTGYPVFNTGYPVLKWTGIIIPGTRY
jgi:hypothetical protein